jgi:hypothetical protein
MLLKLLWKPCFFHGKFKRPAPDAASNTLYAFWSGIGKSARREQNALALATFLTLNRDLLSRKKRRKAGEIHVRATTAAARTCDKAEQ